MRKPGATLTPPLKRMGVATAALRTAGGLPSGEPHQIAPEAGAIQSGTRSLRAPNSATPPNYGRTLAPARQRRGIGIPWGPSVRRRAFRRKLQPGAESVYAPKQKIDHDTQGGGSFGASQLDHRSNSDRTCSCDSASLCARMGLASGSGGVLGNYNHWLPGSRFRDELRIIHKAFLINQLYER